MASFIEELIKKNTPNPLKVYGNAIPTGSAYDPSILNTPTSVNLSDYLTLPKVTTTKVPSGLGRVGGEQIYSTVPVSPTPTPTTTPTTRTPFYPTPDGLPIPTQPKTVTQTQTYVPPTAPTGTRLMENPPGALFDVNTGERLVQPDNVTADGLILPSYTPTEEELAIQDIISGYQSEYNTPLPTKEELFTENLKNYQQQIDSINAIYADLINKAREAGAIRTEGALGSTRAAQARSGLIGSTFGQAQKTNVQREYDDITASEISELANQRAMQIATLTGQARQDASAELEAKKRAKAEGAEALLKYYSEAPKEREAKAVTALKAFVSGGGDISELTEEELKNFASSYKLDTDKVKSLYTQYKNEFDTAQAEAESKALKEAADIAAKEASTAKTLAEIEQIGKMTPYQAAQLGISQAQLKIAQDRAAREADEDKVTTKKNYNESTIPPDIKSELISDVQSNQNAKKKDRKSLEDFFAAYPEVGTDYLVKLYTSYQ